MLAKYEARTGVLDYLCPCLQRVFGRVFWRFSKVLIIIFILFQITYTRNEQHKMITLHPISLRTMMALLLCTAAAIMLLGTHEAEGSLSPPYFDIGKGKNISATATCGEDFTPPPQSNAPGELFCSLADLHGKYSRRYVFIHFCCCQRRFIDPKFYLELEISCRGKSKGKQRNLY